MSEPVNILEARNNLSKLVAAAAAGTDTVIAKRGRPVARITAVDGTAVQTAGGVAAWLKANPPVPPTARDTDRLDAQIEAEREGWE